MIGKAISDLMIKPGKSPVFDSPENYGLDYENVSFKAKDGEELYGWIIKGSNDKVIIQSHFGVQCSRCGYTVEGKNFISKSLWSTDIKFLNQAKYLNDAGYTVLMYDFRNHGESVSKSNDWITWGLEERNDVWGAVNFISNHSDYNTASIGLLSICMGSASTFFAYGLEENFKSFKNITSMIAVQPLTYDYFVASMGLPNFMIKAGNKVNKQRNVDLTGDSFLPYIKEVNVPVMVIQNQNDPMTNLDMVKELYNTLNTEKEMMWLDLDKKRGAAYDWLGHNPNAILNWFNKYA